MKQLYGTGVALVTPFKADLSVDEQALRRIVDYCIDGGVDYLVILGTTGEPVTLTAGEKQFIQSVVIEQNRGRVPLVIGMGGNNTMQLAEEIKNARLDAFEAILSVSPYYNRPTQEGIYRHYGELSRVSPVPIIVYNVPARTGSNMLPETVLRMASDFKNIIGIKEASGEMSQVRAILQDKPADFLVISGDDFTAVPTVLEGGVGVISVLGQGLPTAFTKMIRLALNGNVKEAGQWHKALEPGMQLIFQEGNPAGIKAIFELQECSTAAVRLPLVEASPALKSRLKSFMKTLAEVHA